MKEIRKMTVSQLEALGFAVSLTYYSDSPSASVDITPPPEPSVKEEAKAAKDEMDEALEAKPAKEPKPQTPPDLMPQIRNLMVKATKSLGKEKLLTLLGEFKAKRVSDVKKAALPKFLTALEEALDNE